MESTASALAEALKRGVRLLPKPVWTNSARARAIFTAFKASSADVVITGNRIAYTRYSASIARHRLNLLEQHLVSGLRNARAKKLTQAQLDEVIDVEIFGRVSAPSSRGWQRQVPRLSEWEAFKSQATKVLERKGSPIKYEFNANTGNLSLQLSVSESGTIKGTLPIYVMVAIAYAATEQDEISSFFSRSLDDYLRCDVLYLFEHEKIECSTIPLHEAIKAEDEEEIHRLIELHPESIHMNQEDRGLTPLMLATIYERLDLVEMLLELGATLDQQSFSGNTALHYAAYLDNKDIFDLLVKKGANEEIVDFDGRSTADLLELGEMERNPKSESVIDNILNFFEND